MTAVNLKKILNDANKNNYAVAGLVVLGWDDALAFTQAADETGIPCVVAPGYEMYYFTILGGLSQRSLVQFFQPEHAYQVETIPGIKDMIAKYK